MCPEIFFPQTFEFLNSENSKIKFFTTFRNNLESVRFAPARVNTFFFLRLSFFLSTLSLEETCNPLSARLRAPVYREILIFFFIYNRFSSKWKFYEEEKRLRKGEEERRGGERDEKENNLYFLEI